MDQYGSGDGSGSGSRRRRFAWPATSAYLGPAFNACVTPGCTQCDSPLGVDASLLRYTRPSPSSSSSSNSGKMHRLVQMSSPSDGIAVLDAHEVLLSEREPRSRARRPSGRSYAAPTLSSSASNGVAAAAISQQSGGSVSTAESGVYGAKTRHVRAPGGGGGGGGGGGAVKPTAGDEMREAAEEAAVFEFAPAEEQEYINQVLYGPSRRKRLPVFVDICRE